MASVHLTMIDERVSVEPWVDACDEAWVIVTLGATRVHLSVPEALLLASGIKVAAIEAREAPVQTEAPRCFALTPGGGYCDRAHGHDGPHHIHYAPVTETIS